MRRLILLTSLCAWLVATGNLAAQGVQDLDTFQVPGFGTAVCARA